MVATDATARIVGHARWLTNGFTVLSQLKLLDNKNYSHTNKHKDTHLLFKSIKISVFIMFLYLSMISGRRWQILLLSLCSATDSASDDL